MGTLAAGSVILIGFPLSDLSQTKLRPAVVLATLDKGDCILCQVTSRPYDEISILIDDRHFSEGSLHRPSYARPGKLFTFHHTLIQREVGKLTPDTLNSLQDSVVDVIRGKKFT